MKPLNRLLAVALFAARLASPGAIVPASIEWRPWSASVFEEARRENKFVLLDLEAVWCHWCHVMAETTYKTPAVVKLIQSRYIAVRVDQDSRPDLSSRYEDYGWPATVVFGPDGKEIVKRQGYIPPKAMASVLQAIIDDPTPGPSVRPEPELRFGADAALTPALRKRLQESFAGQYDSKHGSWGFDQKFVEWTSVEYAYALARGGDAKAERMARQTLDAGLKLIDPAWGGVYQYSTGGDWNEPHFEKIMAFQAEDLRIYALAYARWRDPAYLTAALDIHRYLTTFLLSPEGVFYTSQDADLVEGKHSASYFRLDDKARRKLGVPRVDRHVYARENGWAIQSLAVLYAVTGERRYLDEAAQASEWIVAHRALDGGGFRHDAADAAGPYLGDTLAMARAFLSLYSSTGDRQWLDRAQTAARFIAANFRDARAGYATARDNAQGGYAAKPERDENVALVRFANLLSHYTGGSEFRAIAEHAMRYLAEPHIAAFLPTAGVLLADLELTHDPIHITVVGHKDDAAAQALFGAAAAYPSPYKRIEWWDAREGRLPNPDVQYPEMKRAAAFVCTSGTCSSPIYEPQTLGAKVDRLTAPKPASDAASGLF